jgi:uncharacterized Rossmann fold enzyme
MTRKKPQLYIYAMTKSMKPKITIIVSGGAVQDVVKENTNIDLVIHDYDIEPHDTENRRDCYKDEHGDTYQLLKFD